MQKRVVSLEVMRSSTQKQISTMLQFPDSPFVLLHSRMPWKIFCRHAFHFHTPGQRLKKAASGEATAN